MRAADRDRALLLPVPAAESEGVTVRLAARDWGPAAAPDAVSDRVTVREADPDRGPAAMPAAVNDGVTVRAPCAVPLEADVSKTAPPALSRIPPPALSRTGFPVTGAPPDVATVNDGVTVRDADRDSATLPALPDAENEGAIVRAALEGCAEGTDAIHTPE